MRKSDPCSLLRCEFQIMYAIIIATDIITLGNLSVNLLSLRNILSSSNPSTAISSMANVVRISVASAISSMPRWKYFFLPCFTCFMYAHIPIIPMAKAGIPGRNPLK